MTTLALSTLGATGVVLPTSKDKVRLEEKLRAFELKALLVFERQEPSPAGVPQIVMPNQPSQIPPENPLTWFEEGGVFRITESSGSTGQAKIIALSHAQQWERIELRARSLPVLRGQSLLLAMTLNAEVSMTYALYFLIFGGMVIFPPTPTEEGVYRGLQQHRPQWLLTSPYLWKSILAAAQQGGQSPDIADINILLVGARADKKILEVSKALPRVRLYSDYGSTESGMLAMAQLGAGSPPDSFVGRLLKGVECATFDPNTHKPLPASQKGLLGFKAPGLFDGYGLGDRATQSECFVDGWFLTGDIGWVDDRGQLHVSGRQANVINRGGAKFNAETIEQELMAKLNLNECCLSLVQVAGQEALVLAVAGASSKAQATELNNRISHLVSRELIPDHIVFMETLPRLMSGKLDRTTLNNWLASELGTRKPLAANTLN